MAETKGYKDKTVEQNRVSDLFQLEQKLFHPMQNNDNESLKALSI
jgi:hypothetical protein